MLQAQPMDTAPRNGKRILLKYNTYHYSRFGMTYVMTGQKWEECYWVRNFFAGPNQPEGSWMPWTGDINIHSTGHIRERDALAWSEAPNEL